MFMVLSSWHSHCESSPGSFDECRLNAGWPPILRPNLWFGLWVRQKIGCYHPQTPSPFIIITQLASWYSFYRPTEGGRLSRPRHCSKGAQPVPKVVHRSDCRDKHDRPRWDSNLGSLAPQSGVLPLILILLLTSEWKNKQSLTSHSTYNRSCRRTVFPGSWPHWYWQPNSPEPRESTQNST